TRAVSSGVPGATASAGRTPSTSRCGSAVTCSGPTISASCAARVVLVMANSVLLSDPHPLASLTGPLPPAREGLNKVDARVRGSAPSERKELHRARPTPLSRPRERGWGEGLPCLEPIPRLRRQRILLQVRDLHALGGGGQQLLRVEQQARVEGGAQAGHRCQILGGEGVGHLLLLLEADAVLAADRAAHRHTHLQDLIS